MCRDPHGSRWQFLDQNLAHQLLPKSPFKRFPRWGRLHCSHQPWPVEYLDDDHDGRDLAADPAVALPGDGADRRSKSSNTPRLELEEAFHAPKCLGRWPSSWPLTDFVDDEDLYRLGLQYDDEHAYSVRPAKRERRGRGDRLQRAEEAWDFCRGFLQDVVAVLNVHEPSEPAREKRDELSRAGGKQNDVSSHSAIHELPEDSSKQSLKPEAPADTGVVLSLLSGSDGDEWALLESTETETSSVDVVADDDAMSATGDPWIMLGDDS